MKKAGINSNRNIFTRYFYAGWRSIAQRNMDFITHLNNNASKQLFLIGSNAYNDYDTGNFLWGMAMQKLGFDYGSVKVGSEVNGFFNSKRQNGHGYGVTLSGDSVEDQKAIRKGYFWKLNNV